jgi:hypothetical protein
MTYDPLKIIERPKTRMFSGLPSAAPGTVLVVDREGHPVRMLAGSGDRLTAGEVRWGQIRTLYEVDVTEHSLEFRDAFPCKDDIGGFRAVVKLNCAVADPVAVVTRGIHDVGRVLLPKVTETLRRVCGQYPAEDYQQAEAAGLGAIRSLENGPGHDRAFQISHIHLVLSLDDAAAIYVRERKEATRNLTRQEDTARLDREKARLQAELARVAEKFEQEQLVMRRDRERLEAQLADQRQQLELAREAERARSEQLSTGELEMGRLEFERQRQSAQAELDKQKLELELAREAERARSEQLSAGQLEMGRLEFERQRQSAQAELDKQKLELELERTELEARYEKQVLEARLQRDQLQVTQLTDLLSRGQYAALAMQLAQDPAAIGPVSAYLAEQRAADTDRQLQALKLLIENDGLEGWRITEQAKTVLRQLIDTWSTNSGQIPAAESAPGIEAGTPDDQPSVGQPTPQDAGDGLYPGDRESPEADSPAGPVGSQS